MLLLSQQTVHWWQVNGSMAQTVSLHPLINTKHEAWTQAKITFFLVFGIEPSLADLVANAQPTASLGQFGNVVQPS